MALRSSINVWAPRLTALAGLLTAGSACVTLGPTQADRQARATAAPMIVVENHGFSDLQVYAVVGTGKRVRLGRVNALDELRMRLPASLVGARSLRFEVVPTMSGAPYTSDRVLIEEGTELVWRLENELSLSALVVR